MTDTFVRMDGPTEQTDHPPLVLIHGVGLDHTMWDLIVDDLASRRMVIRYDLLGHGRSVDPPGSRSIEDFVDQLLAVFELYDLPAPDVAGLSIGGMIAMAAAARQPDRMGRLALLNTVFGRTSEQIAATRVRLALTQSQGMIPVADLAIDRWFSTGWQADYPERVEAIRTLLLANDLNAYLKAYRVFCDGDPLMPEAAAQITSPTLVMTGGLDTGSTPAMTTAIAAAIPNATAVILSGLRHLPVVEDPGRANDELVRFFG